jgi:hypothetical protein
LSYEFQLIVSQLGGAVYASLHPVSIGIAWIALIVVATSQQVLIGPGGGTEELTFASPINPLSGALADALDLRSSHTPVAVAANYVSPWLRLPSIQGREFYYQATVCLIQLLVWSWAATFICRGAALRMARVDHQWLDVWRFSNRHYFDSLFGVLIPLVTVAVMGVPLVVAGWLLAGDWASVIGSLAAVVTAALALPMALVLLGLLFAWPLMFPAIACEGRDSFESISRSYAYVLQRPVHTVMLAGFAVVIGSVVGFLVLTFFSLAGGGFEWFLSWGANLFEPARLDNLVVPGPDQPLVIRYWSGPLLRFSSHLFVGLAVATNTSMFWGLASGVYLLLRRYLDQTPLDEVYRPGGPGLAPLAHP